MIELADVERAAQRLAGVAHRTPVVTSRTLDERVGARVHLKAECFQRGGAFKFRGAYNKISSLDEEALARGVVAYSSGNHAQAVALAARLLGSQRDDRHAGGRADREARRDARLRRRGRARTTAGRRAARRSAPRWRRSAGSTLVQPYDDPLVMAGQGTVALELLADVPELDLLLAPVSGGGLIAGCATVAKALRPAIRVVGVEPEAGDDTQPSLAPASACGSTSRRTIADGLQATEPGELTFEVNRQRVDEIVTVSDEEIVAAMVFLFDRLKLVAEPSGAVGVAAL